MLNIPVGSGTPTTHIARGSRSSVCKPDLSRQAHLLRKGCRPEWDQLMAARQARCTLHVADCHDGEISGGRIRPVNKLRGAPAVPVMGSFALRSEEVMKIKSEMGEKITINNT